ncbi:MAG TPA: zinc ribbon domain-containing protein [Acidobacteriota bacterium]|jgi:putative FmdB family regulatory protein|nr:zinc ribbon domain-containing protein [Acidobacteriota bacterium]HRR26354.1 zinc ribbon domain-containing protein [Acidobacteriota bacterium]HRR57775.1 zinc ribbon domain-containing protein [Acidobacteriota bacterium]
MPTYEFECLKCRHQFTEILSVSEYEKEAKKGFRCPKCQSRRVEQRLAVQVQTSKKS